MLLNDFLRTIKVLLLVTTCANYSGFILAQETTADSFRPIYEPTVFVDTVVSKLSDKDLANIVYSPPVENTPTRLLWGDTHLHTNLSVDAYLRGTRLTREIAYRFAQGKVVTADNGMKAQLRRPLDFLAIADHASQMGIFPR